MSRIGKMKVLLFMSSLLLSSFNASASEIKRSSNGESKSSKLFEALHLEVLEKIKNTTSVPGIRQEKLESLKQEICKVWEILVHKGKLEVKGPDEDIRPYFVALQGFIEHVLSSQQEIQSLTGIIHTPMPPTPLCMREEITPELVHPSFEKDPFRLNTVKARATILREYLSKGYKLYCAYPQDGLEKRTDEQLAIYREELDRYSKCLFDVPLNGDSIPADLIGATYLFEDEVGQIYVFAIKMTQAKKPQEFGHFGIWFGPVHHHAIQERVKAVFSFLKQAGFDLDLVNAKFNSNT